MKVVKQVFHNLKFSDPAAGQPMMPPDTDTLVHQLPNTWMNIDKHIIKGIVNLRGIRNFHSKPPEANTATYTPPFQSIQSLSTTSREIPNFLTTSSRLIRGRPAFRLAQDGWPERMDNLWQSIILHPQNVPYSPQPFSH